MHTRTGLETAISSCEASVCGYKKCSETIYRRRRSRFLCVCSLARCNFNLMMWFYFEYILLLFAPGIDEENETAASLQGAVLGRVGEMNSNSTAAIMLDKRDDLFVVLSLSLARSQPVRLSCRRCRAQKTKSLYERLCFANT